MLKKSFIFKIISFVIVLVMVTSSTVFAIDFDSKEEKESLIGDNNLFVGDETCVNDFITYTNEDDEYKSTISQQNLNRLKSWFDTDEISVTEMYKEIFRGLGYSEEEIDELGDEEINYIMDESAGITANAQYFIINENGDRELVSKEKCLSFAETVNAKREVERCNRISQIQNDKLLSENGGTILLAATSNSSYNIETKGAVKITTVSSYISPSNVNNEKGWYYFTATFEWITFPTQQWSDAFSLYVDNCAWSQNTNDIYSYMSYNELNVDRNGKTTQKDYKIEKYTKDRKVLSEGIYYSYALPVDYYFMDLGYGSWHSYLRFYIRGKARISHYTTPYAFNLFSQYEHLTKNFSVSAAFAWKVGANYPGVTVSATVNNNHTTFSSYNYTNYNPNYK